MCECVLVGRRQHLLTVLLPQAGKEEWLNNHMNYQKAGHQEIQDFRISGRSFCPQTFPLHACKFTLGFWGAGNPGSDAQSPAPDSQSERKDSDTVKFTASQPWLHVRISGGL